MTHEIYVTPHETPECPQCGSRNWVVWQTITKNSPLERVDGFNDLIVAVPSSLLYTQELRMICTDCRAICKPQQGVSAYHENGGEDEFCWPLRVWEQD